MIYYFWVIPLAHSQKQVMIEMPKDLSYFCYMFGHNTGSELS